MPHFTTRILRAELAHRDECIAFGKCAASKWPDSQAGTMAVGTGAVVYMGPGMYVNRAIGLGLEPFDVGVSPSNQVAKRDPTESFDIGDPSNQMSDDEPTDVPAESFESQIERIEAFCAERNLAPEIQICDRGSEHLVAVLTARGYTLQSRRNVHLYVPDTEASTSTLDVDDEPSDLGQPLRDDPMDPRDFRIEAVDEALFPNWRDVHSEGFTSGSAAKQTNDLFCEVAHAVPEAEDFVALLGDVPVAVASLVTFDGVAWLGGMATRPAYRRRGFQAALLRHRIAHALSSGSDLVVTSTDPESASERNVLRAGFRPLYVQLTYVRS